MQHTYQKLAKKLEELGQLEQIMGILHWDQEVIMPKGATQARAGQIASLAGVAHEKQTDPQIGELLNQLESGSSNDLDPYQLCNIRETRRAYDRETKVPMELFTYGSREDCAQYVKDITRIGSEYKELLTGKKT